MDEAEYEQLVYHSEYDEAALERYIHALASCKMIAAPATAVRHGISYRH